MCVNWIEEHIPLFIVRKKFLVVWCGIIDFIDN